jgi:hypothetical protein
VARAALIAPCGIAVHEPSPHIDIAHIAHLDRHARVARGHPGAHRVTIDAGHRRGARDRHQVAADPGAEVDGLATQEPPGLPRRHAPAAGLLDAVAIAPQSGRIGELGRRALPCLGEFERRAHRVGTAEPAQGRDRRGRGGSD